MNVQCRCRTPHCAGSPSAAAWLLWCLCLLLPLSARCDAGADSGGAAGEAELIQARLQQLGDGGELLLPDPRLSLNQAVAAFYQRRNGAPAWADTARIDALLASLDDLALDGLAPEDYHVAAIAKGRDALGSASPQQRAGLDLLMTRSYLRALTHLYRGRIDPRRFDPGRNFDVRRLDPQQGLAVALNAVDSSDIASAFARARPQHPIYDGLRRAMARLRQVDQQGGWPQVPPGPTLKPGMEDARVPLLRQRLAAGGYLPAGPGDEDLHNPQYDPQLAAAVGRFQDEQYLQADGSVGPATLAALNVPVQARIEQLRVNLERARWLLHEVQGRLVVVDIAGFTLHYFDGGSGAMPSWSTRVQVGKPYRMTPVFKSAIDQITFNPGWVVPPTIYRKDLLPKLQRNPGVLAKMHLRVFDAGWKELPAQSIDWHHPPAGIRLRQDSGADGALGQIKISFPNPYAVYLHATPHQELFGREARAFSSGCIRVEKPLELAERLLDDPAQWNRDAIEAAVAAGTTRTVKLAQPVPVLLAYWTVDLHEGDRIAFKNDIYGLDGKLLQALDQQRVAPAPAARSQAARS